MKKLLLLCSILLISINCSALNDQEFSTVEKLKSWGIVEKPRLFQEYYQPIRTIDAMSMNIKSISLINNLFEKEFYFFEKNVSSKIDQLNNEIESLKFENSNLIQDKFELVKDSNLKDIGLLILIIISFISK